MRKTIDCRRMTPEEKREHRRAMARAWYAKMMRHPNQRRVEHVRQVLAYAVKKEKRAKTLLSTKIFPFPSKGGANKDTCDTHLKTF